MYTTLDLLNSIKVRGMLPDASTGSLSAASLLNLATEELHIMLVPLILSVREKYYETYVDTAIVANQVAYPVAARAIGGVLSVVQYINNNAVGVLTPIDPNEITTTSTGLSPRAYYFQNNSLVPYPTPNGAVGTLRQRYYQRPSRLEQTINCAQVTGFDPVGMTVTCSSVPSTWGAGNQLDFVPQGIPYTPYGLNSPITGVAGNVVTFASLPAALAVGDWLALAEYTPIPEVPFEFFPVLAQATTLKALEALGDTQGMANAAQKLEAYKDSAVKLLTPRTQNAPKKVSSGWRNW